MWEQFKKGALQGIPVFLGYLSVSFGFGIIAVQSGLSILEAALISMTNLTSAGQTAGVAIIAAGGSLLEMIMTQFVINIRYALMGISLTQNLDKSFTTTHRCIAAFGITDEIFAISSTRYDKVTPAYMYGLISVSFVGWSLGTLLGATAGALLPVEIVKSMGIVLYGMFISIIIPPAKKNRAALVVVTIAAALSIIIKYFMSFISEGFAIVISSLIAATVGALLFPIKIEDSSGSDDRGEAVI